MTIFGLETVTIFGAMLCLQNFRYCLATSSGNLVDHEPCVYSETQHLWEFDSVSKQLVSVEKGTCLEVPIGSSVALYADARVAAEPCDLGSARQRFEMVAFVPPGEPEEFTICSVEERIEGWVKVRPSPGPFARLSHTTCTLLRYTQHRRDDWREAES